ncbi:MAG: Na+/H+ antiporter NhaA [Legionellales bacterium]|nr:Na+/H+ antiporter NhaA [Legionellales bacterium]
MLTKRIQNFFKVEALSGIVLFIVLLLALFIANSQLLPLYQSLVELPIQVRIGSFNLEKPAFLWVNDGLMAIFFMLLAMEIKREVLEGDLSDASQMALPIIAAIGGIAIPALIYVALNYQGELTIIGWPIPTMTDIAFTLGVIALLGSRVPPNLKVFVVALSIVDDILAIGIIAIFYTGQLSYLALLFALIGILTLIAFNFLGIKRIAPYLLLGIVIWVCVLQSKVHATLAGVIIGLLIPLHTKEAGSTTSYSPLRRLEHMLHPWVAFFILPIFVFFNGGISFENFSWSSLLHPVPIGIAMGLFLGKSVGIFSISWLVIKLGFAKLPSGSNWWQFYGVSTLTGIGFTMSLFLSALAFSGTEYEDLARKGVLFGSLLSMAWGVLIIWFSNHAPTHPHSIFSKS